MARPRVSYSPEHDSGRKPIRRKKSIQGTSSSSSVNPPSLTLPYLSEEQRRELRARQLAAARGESPPDFRTQPLPDPDLEVQAPRGEQGNQWAGRTVFPEVLGPSPLKTQVRVLPGDADLSEYDPDIDASREAGLDVVAAVSAGDEAILAFDNKMTQTHAVLRDLRQTAERMSQVVQRQDDDPGASDSPTSHAKNIVQMLATILEPWFNAVDDEFTKLLEGTTESESLAR